MDGRALPIDGGKRGNRLRSRNGTDEHRRLGLVNGAVFLLLAVIGLLLITGCRRSVPTAVPTSSPLEELGRLPGLRRSNDPRLKEELARIEEERGTPEQLTVILPPPEENVAAVLVELFPKERLEFLVAQTADWLRLMPDQLRAEDRKAAEELIKSFQSQRARLRAGLLRPKCVFPIRFTAGFGANLGFVDQSVLAVQVEGVAANLAISQGDLASAIDSLDVAFRLCGILSRAKHPQMRWQAALLRRQALDWLQVVVSRPEITRDDLGKLADTLQKELAIWPSDADTWIGARALGMHAYEVVRIGRLYDLLTEREIKQLRQMYDIEELVRITQEHADQDELFYLTQMRSIIALCQKPYYQRVDEMEKLRALWETKSHDDETIIACRVLLSEVPLGETTHGEDLANVHAWLVALRAAREESLGRDVVNPLTGSPFIVETHNDTIYVSGIGTDIGRHGAIEVPRRPPPRVASSGDATNRQETGRP